MEHPIDVYLEWLSTQPKDVQGGIAFSAIVAMRGVLDSAPNLSDAGPWFVAYLEKHSNEGAASTWLALLLIGLTDFCFVGRETQEDWARKDEFTERTIEAAEAEGDRGFAETLRDGQDRAATHAEDWMSGAREWREFTAARFNAHTISQWRLRLAAQSTLNR